VGRVESQLAEEAIIAVGSLGRGLTCVSRLTQRALMRAAACLVAAAPLVLDLPGCAPEFRHLDGSPFKSLGPLVAFDDGWVVVDSGAGGMHALVEIQVEAPDSGMASLRLGQMGFRLAPSDDWSPGRSRVEGPFCPRNGPDAPAQTQVASGQVNHVRYATWARCSYVVRAQFNLDRLPTPGDSVTVVYGGRAVRLRWP
jgi:hypothetical protein